MSGMIVMRFLFFFLIHQSRFRELNKEKEALEHQISEMKSKYASRESELLNKISVKSSAVESLEEKLEV